MNQQQQRNAQPVGAPRTPQSPEEALRMVEVVPVRSDIFLAWMRRLAPAPSQFCGAVYAEMEQLLGEAINAAAERVAASETDGG